MNTREQAFLLLSQLNESDLQMFLSLFGRLYPQYETDKKKEEISTALSAALSTTLDLARSTEKNCKKELRSIVQKYMDKVRHDRFTLRLANCSDAAIEEYNGVAAEYEERIRDKTAELKKADVTLEQIRDTQKWIKKNWYQPVTDACNRIMSENGKSPA